MDWYVQGLPQNVLQISVSPAKMATNTAKKYKTEKMNEIISAVCALLNSGGGKLELCFDNTTTKQHKDACIRMIEQRVVEMVGVTTLAMHVKFDVNHREIILLIRKASKLVSVNYNFYLPSERQVIAVPATESAGAVTEITHRKIDQQRSIQIRSHPRRFVIDQNANLQEGIGVETKSLKASSSKCVTLADRITGKSNKLTSYISAFANHCGGHIYFGINDEGIVNGEEIKEKEKDEIVKKVSKTINKMVWPQHSSQPQRGKEWDIFFEPVEDSNGNPIPATFVIVISVPPCLGGVFTEQPESYYIVEGKINRMSLPDWWRHFTRNPKRIEFLSVPSRVSRVQWSSERNRNICHTLRERLVQYRNDENMRAFNALSQLAMVRFPESGADLIVKAEQIVAAFKHYHYHKVESLFKEFATHATQSKDCSIFEVRMLLLKSVIEHSKGNCEDSYKIVQDGLQKLQQIPVDLTTVWFYIEAAAVITTILTTTHDSDMYQNLKKAGRTYLQSAAVYANSLEDLSHTRSDLRQKLHIYKAWILLECSFSGKVAQKELGICTEDIETAAGEVVSVSESVLKGGTLTYFRKIQYYLVQCDLFHRQSEIQQVNYIPRLQQAFECASNARALARRHRFEIMVDYANKRLADLTEILVRYAFKTCGRQRNKNFFGFQY